MSATRRRFLKSNLALAAAGAGAVPVVSGQRRRTETDSISVPDSEIKVPKVKFGDRGISRLIVGCNTLYGYAHFNQTLGTIMREWYTPEKVAGVLLDCNRYGINTFNYLHMERAYGDYELMRAGGGEMNLIVQGTIEPAEIVSAVQPLAIYRHGETTDRAYQTGAMDEVREYCKKIRDTGALVGVGTHKPEVIEYVEEQGWDVDFYAGCVYNRTRTEEEFRAMLGGELPEMPREIYLQDDPPRMYSVMRQTDKPCFAFKILAAGRVNSPEDAFRQAFEGIKPTDGVFVGMFPRVKNEVKENAYWAMCYGRSPA